MSALLIPLCSEAMQPEGIIGTQCALIQNQQATGCTQILLQYPTVKPLCDSNIKLLLLTEELSMVL